MAEYTEEFGGDKNTFSYDEDSLIGEGSIGIVYRLEEDGTSFALKVFKEDLEEGLSKEFQERSKSLVGSTGLHNYVEVLSVGKTSDGYPAMLMKYGGSDLGAVYKHILENHQAQVYTFDDDDAIADGENLLKRAVKAFMYKAVVSVIDALEGSSDSKGTKISHGDLFKNNILCGFDVSASPVDLESGLIEGDVLLCDGISDPNSKLATSVRIERGVSLLWEDISQATYFFGGNDIIQDFGERDRYGVLALFSWLDPNKEDSLPRAVEYLVAENLFNNEIPKVSHKDVGILSKIKGKIIQEIESSGYFTFDEKSGKVYRPIDRFNLAWRDNKLDSRNKLDAFFKGNSGDSYTNLLGKYEDSMGPEERDRFRTSLGNILSRSVSGLKETFQRKVGRRKELKDSLKDLGERKSNSESGLENLREKLDGIQSILEIYKSNPNIPGVNSEELDVTKTETQVNMGKLDEIISNCEQEISSREEALKRTDTGQEKAAFDYINSLLDQHKGEFHLYKRDQIYESIKMYVGAAKKKKSKPKK